MADISLTRARTIIRQTLAKGAQLGLKPLSVVVVDAGGHVKAFERQDGASPGRFDIALGKAYGCVMLGMGGRALLARAEAQGFFMGALNGLFEGKLVPVPGGVLIRDKRGAILGAVGVTGDISDNDATAALAGIEAVGLSGEA